LQDQYPIFFLQISASALAELWELLYFLGFENLTHCLLDFAVLDEKIKSSGATLP